MATYSGCVWCYGQNNRIIKEGSRITSKFYLEDLGAEEYNNVWLDTGPELAKSYVVQTTSKVVQRCLLMTTDPGDLVLDPTCGSGTTAYVAEQWGRRWITVDTSRVAVTLARQRLLTAIFDYYRLKDESKGISGGFMNKIIPRITLKDIGQNTALDPIFAKHEPILKKRLETLNDALSQITPPAKFVPNCFLNLRKKKDAKENDLSQRQINDVGNFLKRLGRSGKSRMIPTPIGPKHCRKHSPITVKHGVQGWTKWTPASLHPPKARS